MRRRQRSRDERLAAVSKLAAAAYPKAVQDNLALHLIAQYPTWSDGTAGKSVWLIHRNMPEDWEFQLDFLRFAPFASLMACHQMQSDGRVSEDPSAEGKAGDLLAEWVLSTSSWRPSHGESPPSHPSGRFCGEVISTARFLYVESRHQAWRFELDAECATRLFRKCGKLVLDASRSAS